MSGYVYVNGRAVAGAEVEVSSPRGDRIIRVTQVYSGTETQPYYQINLSAPPLNIALGESVTVTARYGGREHTLVYTALPGGQQGDIVLGRRGSDDFAFTGRIWGQAEPGKFNSPYGIAVDSQGFVYVVDRSNARIQVFRGNGQFERQWGFLGAQPGNLVFPRGIAIDSQDNVYVGDANNYRIQKFSSRGTYITSWGSPGTGDGQFEDILMLAADRFDNVYVLDGSRVQRFSSLGEHLATWQVRGTEQNQFQNIPDGLAVDDSGNVYLSGWDGIQGEGRIHKYAPDGTLLARWNRLARFIFMLTIDREGSIYFIDNGPKEIIKLAPNGTVAARWPLQLPAGFTFPTGFAVDQQGNLFVLLMYAELVQRYATTTGLRTSEWGGRGSQDGQLVEPEAVAGGPDGSIYVADTRVSRIQRFTKDGFWMQSWGSPGSGDQQLSGPRGLAIASDGSVYVADTGNHRIRQFTAGGEVLGGWGAQGNGAGQFSNPGGVAVGADGILYVADTGNNRVQLRKTDGTWESWSGGSGTFSAPQGIAIGPDGSVYVADTGNRRVQQRLPNGSWQVWSTPPGLEPTSYSPEGIAVTNDGLVFVADNGNARIYAYQPDGVWLSSFGGHGTSDGLFEETNDLAVTPEGVVAVVDRFNSAISLFSTLSYTLPIATIVHQSAPSYAVSDTVTLVGLGQDSDETDTITAYAWTSDRDGPLGDTAVLTRAASTLTPGSHEITLRVRDDEGDWSKPITMSIYVAGATETAWTMLLYLAGDFTDQGQQLSAFNRILARLGTSFDNPAVRIAVQLDGPISGDTRRLEITPATASIPPRIKEIPVAEQAMDDPQALADFIRWGQATFPAQHYALTIADHGQALQGIAWDTTSDPDLKGYLTVAELGAALKADGVAPIDLLHLDACSMGLLEVAYEVRDRVKILIASQYLTWGYFAYDEYQAVFEQTTPPSIVADRIASKYSARARADGVPFTIAALDLQRLDPLVLALDDLSRELIAELENNPDFRQALEQIWVSSQRFESNGNFKVDELDVYLDLGDWLNRLSAATSNNAVQRRVKAVQAALDGPEPLVVPESNRFASRRLPSQYAGGAFISLEGSRGVSIFYPQTKNSQLFAAYRSNALFSFTRAAQWPTFLQMAIRDDRPPAPLPGPLPPLDNNPEPTRTTLYLPIIRR